MKSENRATSPPIGAWAVHAYTASGAVFAFLATQALFAGDLRATFLWLFAAVLVDSTDGVFARWADVGRRLPHFSGSKLDDIVDYLTFVFVPSLIVWRADLVPDASAVPIAAAILLSSAYGFVSEDAKTSDQFFTGFPSYWNIVVLYLAVLGLAELYNLAILALCAALVFVRVGYIYPTRTAAWRTVTLALGAVWSLLMLVIIIRLPDPPRVLAWVSLFFPAYYAVLSFVLHNRRRLRGTSNASASA
jgi:phosphatidylcholine synthase